MASARTDLEALVEFDVILSSSRESSAEDLSDTAAARSEPDAGRAETGSLAEYGVIEGTLGPGDEPLEALVMTAEPAQPGSVVTCRAIGVFVTAHEDGPAEKVLCVPAHDERYASLRDVADIPDSRLLDVTALMREDETEPEDIEQPSYWDHHEAACAAIEVARKRTGEHSP